MPPNITISGIFGFIIGIVAFIMALKSTNMHMPVRIFVGSVSIFLIILGIAVFVEIYQNFKTLYHL